MIRQFLAVRLILITLALWASDAGVWAASAESSRGASASSNASGSNDASGNVRTSDDQAAVFSPAQRTAIVAIVREALKRDPSILRDAVVALQADEGERTQAATRAAITQAGPELVTPADPVVGNPRGDVTIVEFFDTRCPYCRRMEPVMDQFLAKDGKVRLVYKDLPILGPASVLGTKALLAAQQQGAYEKMREAVMKLPPDTTLPQLESTARSLGLDWPRMARDMDDPAVQARIDANLRLAHDLGIQGTPALVIGSDLVPGAVDLPELQKLVAQARRG